MSFDPKYFGAVVKTETGDARVMCMAQKGEDDSLSVHFFKVDTTLEDMPFNFPSGEQLSFQDELRGTGLAVAFEENPTEDAEEVITRKLKEAYGWQAEVKLKSIDRPSIASLFI